MLEQDGYLIDFKDFDWKNSTNEDMIWFSKTLDFPEPGISVDECYAMLKALEATGRGPITIFETGVCFGTTTRLFIAWTLKYGGEVYSAEVHVRPLFQQKMEEAGYWKYVNIMGNSRYLNWDSNKPINFLFIDSEHALEDALGEYMKYRVYVPQMGIIGFHDYDMCPGVKMAVNIASFVDLLTEVSSSPGGAGIVLYRIQRHNVGGEWLSRSSRINEEIAIYKSRIQEEKTTKEM